MDGMLIVNGQLALLGAGPLGKCHQAHVGCWIVQCSTQRVKVGEKRRGEKRMLAARSCSVAHNESKRERKGEETSACGLLGRAV